ncbi:unnamed protein product [Sphagnum tenellum]
MEIAALTRDSQGATTEDTTAALFVVTKCTVRGLCANEVQRELLFFLGICKIACMCVFHLCMSGQVKDARFLHRNGSMSSGVHEEIGVLFGKADILALGASTSH